MGKYADVFKKVFIWTLLFCFMLPQFAWTRPQGPEISAGKANIQIGPTTTIQQMTDKVIINWNKFSIDPSEMVRFLQRADWIALNRVTGIESSILLGRLTADGRIFLINPNGIIFGKGSTVNVGGLVASTLNIQDKDFLNGNFKFIQDPKQVLSSVVNQGYIRASDKGHVVLLAPMVVNEGMVIANLGQVKLGAGTQATFDFDGAGLINFMISANTKASGNVVMDSKAFTDVVKDAVNNEDVMEADKVMMKNGKVSLNGTENGSLGKVTLKGHEGTLINAGTIYANGAANTNSGNISLVSSNNISLLPKSAVNGSSIDINAGTDLKMRNATVSSMAFNSKGNATSGDIKLVAGRDLNLKESSVSSSAWADKGGDATSGNILLSAGRNLNLDRSNVSSLSSSYSNSNVNSFYNNGADGDVKSENVTSGNSTSGNITLIAGEDLKIDHNSQVYTRSSSSAGSYAFGKNGNAVTGDAISGNSISGNLALNAGRDIEIHKNSNVFSESMSSARTYASSSGGDGISGSTTSGSATSGHLALNAGRDAKISDNSLAYTQTFSFAASNDPNRNVISKNALSGTASSGNVNVTTGRDFKIDKYSQLYSNSSSHAVSFAPNYNYSTANEKTPNGSNNSNATIAGNVTSGLSTSGNAASGSSSSGSVTVNAGRDMDIEHYSQIYSSSASSSWSAAQNTATSSAITEQGPGSPKSNSTTTSGDVASGNATSGNSASGSSVSGDVTLMAKRDLRVDHHAKIYSQSTSSSWSGATSMAISSATTNMGPGAPKSNSTTVSGSATSGSVKSGNSTSGSSTSGKVTLIAGGDLRVDHEAKVYSQSTSSSRSEATSITVSSATINMGPGAPKSNSIATSGDSVASDATSGNSTSGPSSNGNVSLTAGRDIRVEHKAQVYSQSNSTSTSTASSNGISSAVIRQKEDKGNDNNSNNANDKNGKNNNKHGNNGNNGNNGKADDLIQNNVKSSNAMSSKAVSGDSKSGDSKSGNITLNAEREIRVEHEVQVYSQSSSASLSSANSTGYSYTTIAQSSKAPKNNYTFTKGIATSGNSTSGVSTSGKVTLTAGGKIHVGHNSQIYSQRSSVSLSIANGKVISSSSSYHKDGYQKQENLKKVDQENKAEGKVNIDKKSTITEKPSNQNSSSNSKELYLYKKYTDKVNKYERKLEKYLALYKQHAGKNEAFALKCKKLAEKCAALLIKAKVLRQQYAKYASV